MECGLPFAWTGPVIPYRPTQLTFGLPSDGTGPSKMSTVDRAKSPTSLDCEVGRDIPAGRRSSVSSVPNGESEGPTSHVKAVLSLDKEGSNSPSSAREVIVSLMRFATYRGFYLVSHFWLKVELTTVRARPWSTEQ